MNLPPPSIEDLFFAASEQQDPAARSAYLDEACGRETDLRRRLEGLLAVEPKVDQFLESPAVSPINGPGAAVSDENVGTVIGPFKLLEVIGELLELFGLVCASVQHAHQEGSSIAT